MSYVDPTCRTSVAQFLAQASLAPARMADVAAHAAPGALKDYLFSETMNAQDEVVALLYNTQKEEVWVNVFAAAGGVRAQHHYELATFFQTAPDGRAFDVPENDLCDSVPTAMVRGLGVLATGAELDQFYVRDGFFRLECSHGLPAALMAEALLAAFRVVAEVADERVGHISPNRA